MNEHLRQLQSYPKARLDQRKALVVARGVRVFDFGTGDPAEPTPAFVRRAVVDAIPDVSEYPSVHGSDELRSAAAHWLEKRFGVVVDPATEVLATAGSMEAIFHFPMLLVETGSRRDHVVYGEPAYRVFEIATHFAEATRHALTLTAEDRYLLTPEAIGDEVLARTAVVFLNYPHNPSGQEMPAELFERWVAARDEHGFVIVSDECYCDIYFDEPPRSVLEFGRRGCVAVHTLSKRSGMTGYQTGFLAGDPEVVAVLRKFRTAMGVATPVWTQAAAAAAWRDVEHVEERRAVFAQKRSILLEMLEERGHAVYPGTAAMFLWIEVPPGETDHEYAERLLEHGIIVSPGSFFGAEQARFIRLALSPGIDECREAAALWPRD
jgi:succinyldiaminopimelate transaminase